MILFLADVRVKVNRKILLCKRSGGDGGNREIEEPSSRATSPWGRRRRRQETSGLCKRSGGEGRPAPQFLKGLGHLGNGPAMMGPESTGSQACLQWAHSTSRAAASLAPEWVSSATEFFLRQWGHVRSTKTWSGAVSVSA